MSDARRAAGGEIETEILARIEQLEALPVDLETAHPFNIGRGVGQIEALKALRKWIVEEFNAR